METLQQTWVLEISLRDILKAHDIINDIPNVFFDKNIDWVSSDTASLFDEELVDEIQFRLDNQNIEFTLNELK